MGVTGIHNTALERAINGEPSRFILFNIRLCPSYEHLSQLVKVYSHQGTSHGAIGGQSIVGEFEMFDECLVMSLGKLFEGLITATPVEGS